MSKILFFLINKWGVRERKILQNAESGEAIEKPKPEVIEKMMKNIEAI